MSAGLTAVRASNSSDLWADWNEETAFTRTNFTVTQKGVLNAYERCGGIGHYGPTACSQGIDVTCAFQNDYYSQCRPVTDPDAPATPKPAGPKPTKLSPLVHGKPVGFASGVTGGGDAEPVWPRDVNELSDLLQDPEPRVIILDKTFDYTTAMGTGNIDGCKPWGDLEQKCQVALGLGGDWCNREKPDAPKVQGLEFNKAGISPLWIRSHKTIIGSDDKGIIVGRSSKCMQLLDTTSLPSIGSFSDTPQNPSRSVRVQRLEQAAASIWSYVAELIWNSQCCLRVLFADSHCCSPYDGCREHYYPECQVYQYQREICLGRRWLGCL